MKSIYVYILDTLADWEIGLAMTELNSQRFFKSSGEFEVKTFALTKAPVRTMGGLNVLPDLSIHEIRQEQAALMILPGAEEWPDPKHQPVIKLAETFLNAHIPIAAICGATEALARAGMLDHIPHTSNGREYLKMTCPEYNGASQYQDQLAVTGGDLITAGSSSSVDFAYHIFKKLDLMEQDVLDYWYGYFERHSQEDIMKLIGKMKVD